MSDIHSVIKEYAEATEQTVKLCYNPGWGWYIQKWWGTGEKEPWGEKDPHGPSPEACVRMLITDLEEHIERAKKGMDYEKGRLDTLLAVKQEVSGWE